MELFKLVCSSDQTLSVQSFIQNADMHVNACNKWMDSFYPTLPFHYLLCNQNHIL